MRRGTRDISGRPARRGFTLIELLVVIAIIAVVLSLLIVAVRSAGVAARGRVSTAVAQNIGVAAEQFGATFGFAPPLVHDGRGAEGGPMTVDLPFLPRGQGRVGDDGDSAVLGPVWDVPVPVSASGNRFVRTPVVYAEGANSGFLRGLLGANEDAPDAWQGDSAAQLFTRMTNRYDPEGSPDAWRIANQRYSKFSITYYLGASLPAEVDGFDGAEMAAVLSDGSFEGVESVITPGSPGGTGRSAGRQSYTALYDAQQRTARIVNTFVDPLEYGENGSAVDVSSLNVDDLRYNIAVADENGRAFRYYRWRPQESVTRSIAYNIPWVLLDHEAVQQILDGEASENVDVTGGNAELRSATWAIVGAGPDGVFGTEPIGALRDALGMGGGPDWRVRAMAASDNGVKLGR